MPLMTHAPHISNVFVQEANDRSRTARHLIAALSRGLPVPADAWQKLDRALFDVPVLTIEITRLHAELAAVRLERANLAAAGRATLSAHRSGEPSPLTYLRDELSAQGFWREHP
jgi:ABC-type transporter Mla subunit MlaD